MTLPYAPAPPDVVVLTTLPPRLQRMIALLLAHETVICGYAIGCVELHFHQGNVEAKLGCRLSPWKAD